jgi:hypothetical protein
MTQPVGPYRLQSADPRGDGGASPTTHGPPPSDLAQRALSYLRSNELFESLGTTSPPHCAFDDDHDFERCGNDAPVTAPVLFLQQTKDVAPVDVKDVKQGRAGDCALLATLAALASTPEGRAVIQSAIAENRIENGEVVSYTVTLHKPVSHFLGARTFSEVKVTVTPPFVLGHAESRGGHDVPLAGGQASGPHEVWPLVIEQAYAKVRGGYNQTCRSDAPFRAMEALTGKPATQNRLGWLGYTAKEIAADCTAGKLVVLDTKNKVDSASKLAPSHAYQVARTYVENGMLYFQLHNPWNDRDPLPIRGDDLAKWFAAVDVGAVR